MSLQLRAPEDVGLRHVLENGLAILRREEIATDRRDQILEDLVEIFSEASRGSRVLQDNQHLLRAVGQRGDLSRYRLFHRYLPKVEALNEKLDEAKRVFEALQKGQPNADESREAGQLIEKFLEALEHRSVVKPLVPPSSLKS